MQNPLTNGQKLVSLEHMLSLGDLQDAHHALVFMIKNMAVINRLAHKIIKSNADFYSFVTRQSNHISPGR